VVPGDDETVDATFDVFGRKRSNFLTAWERVHRKKEPGANDLRNAALRVANLRPVASKRVSELCSGGDATALPKRKSMTGELDDVLRREFGAFGTIAETRLSAQGRNRASATFTAVVVFRSRAQAEFAKEALTNQGLTPSSPDTMHVTWADASQERYDNVAHHGLNGTLDFQPNYAPHSSLPAGWTRHYDDKKAAYYFHEPTGTVTWHEPSTAEWERILDAASGRFYFANRLTRQVRWDDDPASAEAASSSVRLAAATSSSGSGGAAAALLGNPTSSIAAS